MVIARTLNPEEAALTARHRHAASTLAESLPRLFEPFYRVDTSRDRQTGGSGLGLAIVKTCVETCGGSASLRANTPHGLIIEMELPRA